VLKLIKFWPAAGALSSNRTTSSYTVISWSDKKTKGRFLLAIPTEKKKKKNSITEQRVWTKITLRSDGKHRQC